MAERWRSWKNSSELLPSKAIIQLVVYIGKIDDMVLFKSSAFYEDPEILVLEFVFRRMKTGNNSSRKQHRGVTVREFVARAKGHNFLLK